MTKACTLHVIVTDLDHALDAKRDPREIFSAAPTAQAAWPSLRAVAAFAHLALDLPVRRGLLELGPALPRVGLARALAEVRELLGQLRARLAGERRGDA